MYVGGARTAPVTIRSKSYSQHSEHQRIDAFPPPFPSAADQISRMLRHRTYTYYVYCPH